MPLLANLTVPSLLVLLLTVEGLLPVEAVVVPVLLKTHLTLLLPKC